MSKYEKVIKLNPENSIIEAKLFALSIKDIFVCSDRLSLATRVFCIASASVCHLPHFLIEKLDEKRKERSSHVNIADLRHGSCIFSGIPYSIDMSPGFFYRISGQCSVLFDYLQR